MGHREWKLPEAYNVKAPIHPLGTWEPLKPRVNVIINDFIIQTRLEGPFIYIWNFTAKLIVNWPLRIIRKHVHTQN